MLVGYELGGEERPSDDLLITSRDLLTIMAFKNVVNPGIPVLVTVTVTAIGLFVYLTLVGLLLYGFQ